MCCRAAGLKWLWQTTPTKTNTKKPKLKLTLNNIELNLQNIVKGC